MNEDKRKLEEAGENQAGAKKQKNDVLAAVEEHKSKVKTSETESNVLVPPKKELLVAAEKGPVDLIENEIKPDDGLISEDKICGSAEDAGASEKVPGTATKNDLISDTEKKDNASNGSGSFSEAGEVAATKNALAAVSSGEDATATKKEGESRSREESEEADPSNFQGIKKSISGSEDSSSLEESPEEDEEVSTVKEAEDPARNPEKMNTDVKMMDATPTAPNSEKGGSLNMEAPKTSATLRDQTAGPKTLFLGNLCFSIERTDVEEFFKDAGELVDVRFAMNEDDTFRGFGHIEFATVEAAEKALRELNGKHLLGRRVRLDFIREKGSYTQHSGTETSSHQTARKAQRQTIFIRGFDKRHGEDKIRSALGDHFVSCGEITNISIPIDQDGGIKGIAYIDFKDANAFNNALELNGSEFGEATLTVEGARHRGDGRDSAWSGRIGGGRFGDRRGDSRGYGGHFGGSVHGYGGGHFAGSGHGYGGHFGGGGRGYGGHFGGGGRGYGGHFGSSGRGYTGRFGGDDRGYSGWFASGGRGW